jgi:hypothetical protein
MLLGKHVTFRSLLVVKTRFSNAIFFCIIVVLCAGAERLSQEELRIAGPGHSHPALLHRDPPLLQGIEYVSFIEDSPDFSAS